RALPVADQWHYLGGIGGRQQQGGQGQPRRQIVEDADRQRRRQEEEAHTSQLRRSSSQQTFRNRQQQHCQQANKHEIPRTRSRPPCSQDRYPRAAAQTQRHIRGHGRVSIRPQSAE